MTGDELAGYVGCFKELGIVAVDSRRPEEYSGTKMSRASSKLGRIPGAVSLFFPAILVGDNYKEFKSAEEIKKIFDAKGITPDKNATLLLRERLFRNSALSWRAVARLSESFSVRRRVDRMESERLSCRRRRSPRHIGDAVHLPGKSQTAGPAAISDRNKAVRRNEIT